MDSNVLNKDLLTVSAYNYLETFTNGKLKFADLNEKFCNALMTIRNLVLDKINSIFM